MVDRGALVLAAVGVAGALAEGLLEVVNCDGLLDVVRLMVLLLLFGVDITTLLPHDDEVLWLLLMLPLLPDDNADDDITLLDSSSDSLSFLFL